jgi:hypothetical protein
VRAVAHELLGRVELDAPVRLIGVGLNGLGAEGGPRLPGAGDGRLFAEA